jgi:hypothetical protein
MLELVVGRVDIGMTLLKLTVSIKTYRNMHSLRLTLTISR